MSWNILDDIGLLLLITAAFAYFNHYFLRLPRNTGLLIVAFGVSLVIRLLDYLIPTAHLSASVGDFLARSDLSSILLDALLAPLLFAAALEMDAQELWRHKWTVLALATVGVVLSTLLMAAGASLIFDMIGIPVTFAYCLVFGALISPTDPVAVADALRRAGVPRGLQAIIAGESMFNDGIGIVLYTLFLHLATAPHATFALGSFVLEFLRVAGGGVLLGLVTGGVAFVATRGIAEHNVEVMISLALAIGTYGLAQTLGVSGPVAVVTAGIIMGSIGVRYAVSGTALDYLEKFWSLTDQLLNALLFLLIGFVFAALRLRLSYLVAAFAAIPLAIAVRAICVALPALPLNFAAPRKGRATAILTWSGLRGGISVALALSLPAGSPKDALVTVCYGIVIFTMIVQGLTLEPVAARFYGRDQAPAGG